MEFTAEQFINGMVLLVDKPKHWTSFDVVNKLRYTISKKTGKIKVGHAGTLDPLATGLLIICTGKKTKELDSFQAQQKEYTGTLKLGATTISYDAETEECNLRPIPRLDSILVANAIQALSGEIEQSPPPFSAIKVEGKRAYNLARNDKTVELPKRKVEIFLFEITNMQLPYMDFRVICSKGTYIRSLVHDFGEILDCGAYMTSLRRTKNGTFSIEEAWSLEELINAVLGTEKNEMA